MSDLISRKALLEELKNTYVPVSVKLIDLITNAPAIEQGEPKGYMWPEVESISLYKDEFFTVPLYTAPPQPQSVKDALKKAARIVQAKIGHYYPTPLTDAVTEIRALIEK